jgi:DNA repair protein RadA/Sms
VGGLTSLVADIAARGSLKGNREGAAVEKNATPARFRRQEG